jgi:hypothetical protein
MKYIFLIIIILTISFMSCSKDNSTAPATMATEIWESAANDTLGSGNWTINKYDNGSYNINGSWVFSWSGTNCTCPFTNGTFIQFGDSVSFTGNGTANYPAAPQGYQNSPFTLKVNGIANGGNFTGNYEITFSTYGWPQKISGSSKAKRTSGSGITN